MKKMRAFNPAAPDRGGVDVNIFCCECGGLCFSVPASRLSEAIGVENWQCDKCGQKYAHDFRAQEVFTSCAVER